MIYTRTNSPRMDLHGLKYLVVGAGLFGSTIAERIATNKKAKVVVLEKRDHIGGNSYSEIEERTGIECHRYGSHIFHTKSEKAWRYITQFCTLNHYRHKVLSHYKGRMYPIPINLETINLFYGLEMTPEQAKQIFFPGIGGLDWTQHGTRRILASKMGKPLYEAFIAGYTTKQWGLDSAQLPTETFERLPFRFNYKADYFDDPWQGVPLDGYTRMIEGMLTHENVDVYLGIDYFDVKDVVPNDCCIIFSGPVDKLFNYKYGRLNWRSVRFEQEIVPIGDYQGTAVVNFPEAHIRYIRIHEYKHFHQERCYPRDSTVIAREYPIDSFSAEDPSYPVNTEEDKKIYQMYQREQKSARNVILGGRLGNYAYLNMDETILSALSIYEEQIRCRPE